MIDYKRVVNFQYDNIETKQNMELLSKAILNEIQSSIYDYGYNARLNYSFFNTEELKDRYSAKRFKLYRKKLGKCKGELASTLEHILKAEDNYTDNEGNMIYEIQNYLFFTNFDEIFDQLPKSYYEEYDTFIKHSKHDIKHIKKFVKYLKLLMEYLSCKSLIESRNTTITNLQKESINLYPRFFTSIYAYRVFERLSKTVKNPLADFSFIYRKMIEDKLIYETIGDSEFRQWLSTNYEVEIDKTKQLHLCSTASKEQLYSTIKSIIKEG